MVVVRGAHPSHATIITIVTIVTIVAAVVVGAAERGARRASGCRIGGTAMPVRLGARPPAGPRAGPRVAAPGARAGTSGRGPRPEPGPGSRAGRGRARGGGGPRTPGGEVAARSGEGAVEGAVVGHLPGTEGVAVALFVLSIAPYLVFLHYLQRVRGLHPLAKAGFTSVLAFVVVSIPLEFWAQRHYGDTVSNVDWLHLPLSSLTTLSNVVIFVDLAWSSGQLAPAGWGGAGKPKAAARPAEDDAPS